MPSHSSTRQESNIPWRTLLNQTRDRLRSSVYRPGVHTRSYLLAAGFIYTGDRDTARCDDCGLEISNWTVDMVPFTIHSERSPYCPYVRFMKTPLSSSTTAVRNISMLNEQQNVSERHSIESDRSSNSLIEPDLLQQVRRRTFSHWPHYTTPSGVQMVEAGFFNCNFGDRVICIYCNLICQGWTSDGDNPCEVHRTLSPDCIFVKALLTPHGPIVIINGDGSSMRPTAVRPSYASNNINSLQISSFVRRAVQNHNDGAIRNDVSSSNRSSSIDDCIQRTYFNTDKKNIVYCPSCHGAFGNLDLDENTIIDHTRQFPHCTYARELCGEELYRQIHGSNRPEQGMVQHDNVTLFVDNGQLVRLDEDTLSRLVAARLDLPISQTLIQRYGLRLIKICWKVQLRLKGQDFVTDCDLKVACLILKKQEEHIHGERGLTIPSASMRQWREREAAVQAEITAQIRAARGLTSVSIEATHICVVCLVERRVLAFLPCGHLATCVPCGHSFNLCPVCRRKREAFLTINT